MIYKDQKSRPQITIVRMTKKENPYSWTMTGIQRFNNKRLTVYCYCLCYVVGT